MPIVDTQLQNLKITKVRKETNYEPWRHFKASLVSPATSAGMWFDSRLRHTHNTSR